MAVRLKLLPVSATIPSASKSGRALRRFQQFRLALLYSTPPNLAFALSSLHNCIILVKEFLNYLGCRIIVRHSTTRQRLRYT
jgi:hypothetical protein